MKKHEPTDAFIIREDAEPYFKHKMAEEEYLEFENNSEEKHEYYDGDVFVMQGAALDHGVIAFNTGAIIKGRLKGSGCRPYLNNLRVYIPEKRAFLYPDISVYCADMASRNNDKMNFLNPKIIMEVLSPSTRSFDLNKKFQLYQTISNLLDYVLIDTLAVRVIHFTKSQEGNWDRKDHLSLENVLRIDCIQVEIPLLDIYEDTDLLIPGD